MIDLSRETPIGVADVARLFGVHRNTVEDWFDAGLESVKLRGRVFTTREALNRFAKPREPAAEPPKGTQRQMKADTAARELEKRYGI